MKKVFYLLFFVATSAHAASLDIGTNYRLRGISMDKTDFGATTGQEYSYYSQRLLAHIGGKFSPNIEFMTQFQAIGIAGSSSAIVSPIANPSGSRYPHTDFTPWVQLGYVKATQLYDLPVDITFGRQSILLGDGFLLSDDDLGFTGIRLEGRLPWYGLQAQLFTFKTSDSVMGSHDTDLYGFELTKPTRNIRYQASIVTERDKSGSTIYIRPSENSLTFAPGTDLRASKIERTFYDARIEGRLREGGFYKGEFALQSGSVDRSTTTLGDVDLGGYAFLVSGGLFTRFSKYGPIEIHGLFGVASGDSGGSSDNSFRPSFGHKYDGLERSGFGEFYGSTLYDAIPSSTYGPGASTNSVSGLPIGHSGIRVIGAGVTTHPTSLLSIGIDYFVFTSQESTNFSAASSESGLGTEIDIGVGFAYTNYLSFRGTYAIFSPGAAYGAFTDNATRIVLEAVGRF